MNTQDREPTFKFTRNERGTVTEVTCSCGWVGTGNGGASAFGQAWGAHANEAHNESRLHGEDESANRGSDE